MGWLSDIVGEDTANFLETGDRDKGGDELFGGDSGGETAALLLGLGLAPFTGGASLGAASAYLGYLGQKDINKSNAEQALAQMSFQERMSSTAHQREVQDLRLAGLNPILSANGGSSSPSGAMAVLQNPARELSSNIVQIFSNAQSAAATKLTNANIATQRTQQALNVAQSQNIQAETINKLQQKKPNLEKLQKFH